MRSGPMHKCAKRRNSPRRARGLCSDRLLKACAISASQRDYEISERFQPTRTPSASIERPSAERLANGFVLWILWTPRPIHIEVVARDHDGRADHRTLFKVTTSTALWGNCSDLGELVHEL